MGDVVAFPVREDPTISGPAVCIACKHQWQAVVPVGVFELECPACSSMRGVLRWNPRREGYAYVCKCGCDMFSFVSGRGLECLACGVLHEQFYEGVT